MTTKTIRMSYDNFESAILSFLYQTKTLSENEDVVSSDFGIPLNDEGLIEFELELNTQEELPL